VNGLVEAKETRGDAMKIGIVRVEAFKKMAWAVKKRIEGCKHHQALDKLARACGMNHYQEILEIRENGLPTELLMQDSRDELMGVWVERITEQFGVDIATVFNDQELDAWFTRVFVDRAWLVADVDADDDLVKEVHDPRLEAANWRDAEFRQWLQRVVELEMPDSRPLVDEQEDGDDSDEASTGQSGMQGRPSAASSLVEE